MQILILFIFFNYIFKKITVQFYVITNFHLIHLESIYNFTIFDKNDKCIYISHFSTLQKGKWDKNSLEEIQVEILKKKFPSILPPHISYEKYHVIIESFIFSL